MIKTAVVESEICFEGVPFNFSVGLALQRSDELGKSMHFQHFEAPLIPHENQCWKMRLSVNLTLKDWDLDDVPPSAFDEEGEKEVCMGK